MSKATPAGRAPKGSAAPASYTFKQISHDAPPLLAGKWGVYRNGERVATFNSRSAAKRDAERMAALAEAFR